MSSPTEIDFQIANQGTWAGVLCILHPGRAAPWVNRGSSPSGLAKTSLWRRRVSPKAGASSPNPKVKTRPFVPVSRPQGYGNTASQVPGSPLITQGDCVRPSVIRGLSCACHGSRRTKPGQEPGQSLPTESLSQSNCRVRHWPCLPLFSPGRRVVHGPKSSRERSPG